MRKNVIIDFDPGVDDTIALMMAIKSNQLNIIALTTVFGNSTIDNTTRNALILKEFLKFDGPVYQGASKPLFYEKTDYGNYHGSDGLANVVFEENIAEVTKKHAWDVIYDEALKCQGDLSLIALGPLTNVAIALFKYEDLKKYVKEIIIMGGSATTGNKLPFSEANVVSDAYAMQAVLQSEIPLTMVGLNATEQTRLSEDEYNEIVANNMKIDSKIKKMLVHYKEVQNNTGARGLVIHDAAAMFVALNDDDFKKEHFNVDVELVRNSMFGRTIVDIRKHSTLNKNCGVITEIDKSKYLIALQKALEFGE